MADPIILHQKINLPYRYTAGEFHKLFLRGLAERRIFGSRCAGCHTVAVPARPFCPNCSAHSADSVDMSPEAELVSWTSTVRDGQNVTFGLVKFNGADTEMLHYIDAGDVGLAAGLRLVPRWSAEPSAEITAIDAFVPA